jgi:hypothetical protein
VAWEQLESIIAEAVMYVRDEKTNPPLACPFDGEPLSSAPDGNGLFCKWGNYEYPRMRRII